jgi:hypothetical protein
MTVFRPFQKAMLTDRIYRMYAPDPRTSKRIPFLELKTDRNPVRFYNPALSVFAREKWTNFVDHLAKAMEGGFLYSEEEGAAIFRRLAGRICQEESGPGDRVRTVKLRTRGVFYGEFRGDIVWDAPEILETYACP